MIRRWPDLSWLASAAASLPSLDLWLFGSALRRPDPRDLDVLAVYGDRESVVQLRCKHAWEECSPPIDLIAMTFREVVEYDFLAVTGAIRLQAPSACRGPGPS